MAKAVRSQLVAMVMLSPTSRRTAETNANQSSGRLLTQFTLEMTIRDASVTSLDRVKLHAHKPLEAVEMAAMMAEVAEMAEAAETAEVAEMVEVVEMAAMLSLM